MQRNNRTRLFPLFIILVIVALVIAAAVSIGRAVFNGSDSTETSTVAQDIGRESLLKTDTSRSVSLTVRGPIVADESFNSYRITVSPDQRTMDVYTGYLDDRTGGKKLGNNTPAYEQFVYALDRANMMLGTVPSDDAANDLRGICATGYIYDYAVLSDDKTVKHLWTSTCKGSVGSLEASVVQLNNLFMLQIPNAEELVPFSGSQDLSF